MLNFPKRRAELKGGEWFPYVISKIAPLEWWVFETSQMDVKRKNYQSDLRFRLSRQNTWQFPRFCYLAFRPSPGGFRAFHEAIETYPGTVNWVEMDGCVGVMPYPRGMRVAPLLGHMVDLRSNFRNSAKEVSADPILVQKALEDIPSFCAYLERQLGLVDVPPKAFDPQWLTREGLLQSKGEFEEFCEPGTWPVFLAEDPQKFQICGKATSPRDRLLGMQVANSDYDRVLKELGAKWVTHPHEAPEVILPSFPLMARLSAIENGAVYGRDEVSPLLEECARAWGIVKAPGALRTLDVMMRIARIAQRDRLGISFGGL